MDKNVLYINTSTERLQLAVVANGNMEKHVGEPSAKRHNATILGVVEQLLDKCGISIVELDYIAVVIGPGSFTGIRIGVSTALALARGSKARAVGVTALEVAAFGSSDCLVALDCLHDNYYVMSRIDGKDEYFAGTGADISASKLTRIDVPDDTLDALVACVNKKIDDGAEFSSVAPFYLKKSSAEREAK